MEQQKRNKKLLWAGLAAGTVIGVSGAYLYYKGKINVLKSDQSDLLERLQKSYYRLGKTLNEIARH